MLNQFAWCAQIDLADDGDAVEDVTIRAAGITESIQTYTTGNRDNPTWEVSYPINAGYANAWDAGGVWYLDMQVPYSALPGIDINTPIRFFFHTSTTEQNDIKDATVPSATMSGAFALSGITTFGSDAYGFLNDTRDSNPYSSAGTYNSGEMVYLEGYGWPYSTTMNVRIKNASDTQMWTGTVTSDGSGNVSSTASWLVDYSAASGIYTIEVQSPKNGSYNDYDTFTVNKLMEPEIQVTGNSTSITDGDATPSTADDSDFGIIDLNTGTEDHTFTITNIGNTDLTLGGSPYVAISGSHASDFTVTQQPTTPITSGNSVTYTIRFNPSAIGVRTATVTIINNDTNESTFDYSIQGTGALLPEIQISGTGVTIADGDMTPTSADETDFGDANGNTQVHTFRIDNLGSADLTLNGSPLVSISGTHAADFTVTQNPSSTITGGSYTTFEITFDPSGLGSRTATVSIDNNDLNEDPYTFAIEGNGISAGTPFSCSSAFRHFLGSSGSYGTVSTGSNPYSYTSGGSVGYTVNAAGYSVEDGLIYAHERGASVSGDNLIRLDAAGVITVLSVSVPFGADVGDCDNSGNYYFVSGSSWGKYDISTATMTSGSLSASFSAGDMAFIGSSFYGVYGKILYIYNPSGNSVSTSTLTGTLASDVDGSVISGSFAAAWSASDGYLYVLDSGSNRYYKVDVGSGLSFYAGTGSGGTSITDGASCHSSASPLPDSGTVGNYVWMDYDNDGIQDSNEYGLNNVTVTLYRSDATQISSTSSGSDGAYSFSNIPAEQYYVTFSNLPTNFSFASQDQGADDSADSDANTATGQTTNFIVDAYETENGWDAGAITTGAGNWVWDDADQDGIQDAGETGLSGVSVELQLGNGTSVSTTTTDSYGRYLFSGLTAGTQYQLVFSNLPGGYQISTQNAGGDDTVDSDPSTSNSKTAKFSPNANEVDATWDAGLIQTSFPEMRVEGNSTEILDGDTTPDASDDTDFGSVSIASGTVVKSFTIYNTGSVDLSLLGTPMVAVSGTHASDFTVTVDPASPVSTGSNTSYTVTFDPSAGGLREATLSISNNDADENPYNYNIQGIGLAPDMDVLGNSVSIADNDNAPESADHTDFGEADITSGSVTRTFTIDNTGNTNLNLTGSPIVEISGTHASDFSVAQQPSATTLAHDGGTLTFQITFNPDATGLREAIISIDNDDPEENPYNYSIQGTGTSGPEMDVQGNSNSIPDNDNTPSTADHTSFGSVDVNGGTLIRTFTIRNTGNEDLNLSGTPIVALSGTHASDFTVVTQPASSVVTSGGGTSTFQVQFNPSDTGDRTATISITNDDNDENPYNFDIEGHGYPYISIADASVNENDGTVTITVTLTGSYISGVSVDYATADSTATDGNDYTATNGTLNWASGVSGDKTFTVPIVDNGAYDPEEYFKVLLSNISNATFVDSLGIVTIVDNEVPEMLIEGNDTEIADGDNTPSTTDFTDFDSTFITGTTVVRNFKIKNTDVAPLRLTDASPFISISGSHASDFSVTVIPADSIPNGDSTTFQITFDPSATGDRTATISIANNDSDENPYTFDIKGYGEADPLPQLVLVKSVDQASATPGDTLTYTINYSNSGDGDATSVIILDSVPTNTTYIENSAAGSGMTLLFSHDGGGSYNASQTAPVTDLQYQRGATLVSGGSGSITFKVKID